MMRLTKVNKYKSDIKVLDQEITGLAQVVKKSEAEKICPQHILFLAHIG